ncbi:hypothetical protein, partial [Brevibacillus formosus]|uniref:hypothetical protein n=1 Tax=Brevibacillus formosus TaxID=54913 RepID=UPI001C627A41
VLPSGEAISGQKKRNVPELRSGYHFCVSPLIASERAVPTSPRDGAWSLDWKYSSPHDSHFT